MEIQRYRAVGLLTTRRKPYRPRPDIRRPPRPLRLLPQVLEHQIEAALDYLTKPGVSLDYWLASKSFTSADAAAIRAAITLRLGQRRKGNRDFLSTLNSAPVLSHGLKR